MSNRRQGFGAYGERVAARHLVDAGMTVVDRNWRCDIGEVDLVLLDGDVVVFCEVKTRSGPAHGTPIEAVGDIKVERLRRLADRWLADRRPEVLGDAQPGGCRIDLVGVVQDGHGAARVEHVSGIC